MKKIRNLFTIILTAMLSLVCVAGVNAAEDESASGDDTIHTELPWIDESTVNSSSGVATLSDTETEDLSTESTFVDITSNYSFNLKADSTDKNSSGFSKFYYYLDGSIDDDVDYSAGFIVLYLYDWIYNDRINLELDATEEMKTNGFKAANIDLESYPGKNPDIFTASEIKVFKSDSAANLTFYIGAEYSAFAFDMSTYQFKVYYYTGELFTKYTNIANGISSRFNTVVEFGPNKKTVGVLPKSYFSYDADSTDVCSEIIPVDYTQPILIKIWFLRTNYNFNCTVYFLNSDFSIMQSTIIETDPIDGAFPSTYGGGVKFKYIVIKFNTYSEYNYNITSEMSGNINLLVTQDLKNDELIEEVGYVQCNSETAESTIPPKLMIDESVLITDISNPISYQSLKASITATTASGSYISQEHIYILEDPQPKYDGTSSGFDAANVYYPSDTTNIKVGSYKLPVYTHDSSGNVATAMYTINVIDTSAPVITGPTSYRISNAARLQLSTLENLLTITDAYDSAEDITIKVVADGYSDNWATPGTYQIIFKATDASNNFSTHLITIEVFDGIAPKFYDEDNNEIKETIVNKNKDAVLLAKDIIKNIKCLDNLDGEVEIKIISDTFTGHGDTEGTYKITLSAMDSEGNTTTHTIIIYVVDTLPSTVYVMNGKKIVVASNNQLTNNDFVNILQVCGYYSNSTTNYIDIDAAVYTESYNVNGSYPIGAKITTTSGTETELAMIVQVVDPVANDSTITKKELSVWQRFCIFIKNVWTSFWNWLRGLFSNTNHRFFN